MGTPDTHLFLYLYVRKEALLSSQIEGTKSSFSDLLLFENEAVPGVPIDDVEEVSNYVAAMQHGLRRIKGGFPLSLRLIREIHAILLCGRVAAISDEFKLPIRPLELRRNQSQCSSGCVISKVVSHVSDVVTDQAFGFSDREKRIQADREPTGRS